MAKKYLSVFVIFMIFYAAPLYAEDIQTGRISGQLMIKDGGPMSDGAVFFFNDGSGPPPSPNRYWRVPDVIGRTDADGRFSVELVEGSYYMGAVKRVTEKQVGPPNKGDYFFISRDMQGNPKAYIIEKGKSVSTGVIPEAVPFERTPADDITGIRGTITDMSGKPVKGAIVFAYFTPTMLGLPLFVSDRTGEDGGYMLLVSKGGKYYLRVRDVYGGGPPSAGSVMGGYGEEKPSAVTVKTGEITGGIDIRVIRHLQRGPKSQQRGGAE